MRIQDDLMDEHPICEGAGGVHSVDQTLLCGGEI